MKPEVDHLAVIIGAGLGGLGMAIALKRAGIEDYVVLERADGVVRAYIEDLVDRYRLDDHLRLRHDVTSREWDSDGRCWLVGLADGTTITGNERALAGVAKAR